MNLWWPCLGLHVKLLRPSGGNRRHTGPDSRATRKPMVTHAAEAALAYQPPGDPGGSGAMGAFSSGQY